MRQGLPCPHRVCVPLYADPGNCVACGNVCTPPAICEDVPCRVIPGTCLPPEAALQAAINATGRAPVTQTTTLTLCKGRFTAVGLVVNPTNAPLGIHIVGAGAGKTILDGQGQDAVIKVLGGGPNTVPALLHLIGLTLAQAEGSVG